MKLFLASEAKHPDTIQKLRTYIGGSFQNKKIAYIPTAGNGEFYGGWKGGGSINTVQSLGADLNIIELEDCAFRDVIAEIRGADILWIAGGMSGYLAYWMRRTELDKALPDILKDGTLYVGSSAGSMVCSTTQRVGEWYLGEPEPGAGVIPGLGLIDFEIYPHYEDDLLSEIKMHWKAGELYLLKNGEVITVEDGKVDVLGETRIIKI